MLRVGNSTALIYNRAFRRSQPSQEEHMLWTLFVILVILWLLGFSFHVAGGLVHVLLVIAAVVLIINLVSGRRTA